MQKFRFSKSLFALLVCLQLPVSAAAQSGFDTTVLALAIPETNRAMMYAGTSDGLFISRDNGKDWSQLGLEGRQINDIVIHPQNADLLYAAAGNDGVMKSTNGGKDWTTLSFAAAAGGTLPAQGDIRAITVDKSNPSTVYAASFQGHIFKSTDAGQSWVTLNDDFPIPTLNAITVDPVAGTFYIGTGGNGVYKSTDNGNSWTPANNGLDDLTVTRVLVDPTNKGHLYAGTYGSGVFMSQDDGQTWQAVGTELQDAYVYSMAAWPKSVNANFSSKSARERPIAELVVGVYGGKLYSMTDTSSTDWQPLGSETRRM